MALNYKMDVSRELNQLAQRHDLKIGGTIFNENNLTILDGQNHKNITNDPGCYFIFSTLKEFEIHTWSNYEFFNRSLIRKNGLDFRCIYNGTIGKKGLRQRITEHIVNSATIRQVKENPASHKLCTTGSMSLEGISKVDWEILYNSNNFLKTAVQNFQNPRKLPSCSQVQYKDMYKLANGININEPQWSDSSFAIITITFDAPDFRKFLEHAFRTVNGGKPPLCNR